jgi:hypothetical protein
MHNSQCAWWEKPEVELLSSIPVPWLASSHPTPGTLRQVHSSNAKCNLRRHVTTTKLNTPNFMHNFHHSLGHQCAYAHWHFFFITLHHNHQFTRSNGLGFRVNWGLGGVSGSGNRVIFTIFKYTFNFLFIGKPCRDPSSLFSITHKCRSNSSYNTTPL